MDLKELGMLDPYSHWYYKHKSYMLMNLYQKYRINSKTVIEVGAGSGFFCKNFFRKFNFKNGYCIDPNYSDMQIDLISTLKFQRELPKMTADLYLYIDVLEHIDDPLTLLRETVDFAESDSIFLFSVPAFKYLWSNHDVYLGHKKRYRINELEELVNSTNLEILHARYIFAPIFPLVLLKRKFFVSNTNKSDMRKFNFIANFLLTLMLGIEKCFEKNRVFGTSAVIIAKKR